MIQLVCSNCGADLNDQPLHGGRIQCPYCGTINEFKGIDDRTQEQSSASPKIFYEPITLSVDDVDKKCTDALAEDELAPDDIYQEISMKGYRLLYLPFCVVGGKFSYSFSIKQNDANSNVSGTDSIYKRFLLYTGSDVALPLQEKMNNSSVATVHPLQFAADEGTIELLKQDDKVSVCEPNVKKDILFSMLENEARDRESKKLPISATVLNTQFTPNFQYDHIVYVPYYIVELNYKGQPYYIAACASSSGGFYCILPIDEERSKTFKELSSNYSTLTISLMVLPFILGVLWLFGPLKFGTFILLSIISWAIAAFLFVKEENRNDKMKAQILEESRKKRLLHKI